MQIEETQQALGRILRWLTDLEVRHPIVVDWMAGRSRWERAPSTLGIQHVALADELLATLLPALRAIQAGKEADLYLREAPR
jgi:hypothetical protein